MTSRLAYRIRKTIMETLLDFWEEEEGGHTLEICPRCSDNTIRVERYDKEKDKWVFHRRLRVIVED